MSIDKNKANVVIRDCSLSYATTHSNPESNYDCIELYHPGEGLPISTIQEYEIANGIAKQYNLALIQQDFGKGEGMNPDYKPVYAITCKSLKELRSAEGKLRRAEIELEKKLKEI